MFRFFACMPEAVAPRTADPTLFGSAIFRAATHCDPFRTATGYGWYVYPPVSFHLRWDGGAFFWLPVGASGWLPLTNVPARSVHRLAGGDPPDLYVLGLPFLSALPEPGYLQVWSGLAARSDPGWSALVSPVANLPAHPAYEVLEGVIETDWFHGPLLTNLRFRKTDQIVHIDRQHPMFMVRPLRKECYSATRLNDVEFVDFSASAATSDMVQEAMGVRRESRLGGYRNEAMRRRRISIEKG